MTMAFGPIFSYGRPARVEKPDGRGWIVVVLSVVFVLLFGGGVLLVLRAH
jgi:hypothetical protein